MKYHGFIFNDMKSAGAVPTKSAGSYSISSICRLHGYNIKVIDNIMFIIENNFEQLKDYLDDVVSGDTIFFGFSTTFMDDPEKFRPLILLALVMIFIEWLARNTLFRSFI